MSDAQKIKDLSGAISKFGDAASKGATTLAKFEDLMSTASKLAKLGTGLGMVGAGLGVIATLAGAKSDTDRVLDAIAGLSHQVDNLDQHMNEQFEHLEDVVRQSAAKTQLFPEIATLKAVSELMEEYGQIAKHNPNSADAEVKRDELRAYTTSDMLDAAEAIHMQMTNEALASHILEATYRLTHGDLKTIGAIGAALFMYINLAKSAHVTLACLGKNERYKPSKSKVAAMERSASKLFDPLIREVNEAWQAMMHKCINNMRDNVEGKLRELMRPNPFNPISMFHTNHKEYSKYLRDGLSEQFFWCDWLAIVYDAVSGYDTHGMWGWNFKAIFREYGINVVVKWVDERERATGKKFKTKVKYDLYDTLTWWGKANNVSRPGTMLTGKAENVPYSALKIKEIGKQIGVKHPGFIWRCKRLKGVHAAWSNSSRCKWVNGSTWTVCVFS